MAVQFSNQALGEYQRVLSRYPINRAALMPVLWIAQREFGCLSPEVQQYVADLMGFPLAWVSGVASFYTMYYKKPIGKYHLQVCTNVSCMLRGSDEIVRAIEERLGIGLGETTTDGRFSLDEVECLASCGTAPMMQVNEDYHENLTAKSTIELLDRLGRD
ncbi:MAG TPA: NAD(P)H-dependent oxidoreductase subunit E [Candidatus Binatia bacterium]|nr:NAD(P)H-dependent oxidoreductase subunit E [Candidatus Binatia bacterium]